MFPMVSGLADFRDSENDSPSGALSGRQRQILELLTQGKANKEIAYELGIGVGTVKQHLVALYKKMGVTNRAMAVSKGFSSIQPVPSAVTEDELYLERRSAVVLSLQVVAKSGKVSEDEAAAARRIFSQNALDFDALFLSSPGARGDVILGLERTRRYDCLRAVRLAISVSLELNKQLGPDFRVRGGMSCGFVLKGIDEDGAWTGEVIATEVITEARQSMAQSLIGSLALSDTALQAISAMGVQIGSDGIRELPLSKKFRWSYISDAPTHNVFGLGQHLGQLFDGFTSLLSDEPRTYCIESGAGMGRTALVRTYDEQCARQGIPVHFFKALTPNTRPSGVSRGLIEPMGTTKPPASANVILERLAKLNNCVVVIEDCHALPHDELDVLVQPNAALADAHVQLVLTYRGRLGPEFQSHAGVNVIRLSRLEENDAAALAKELAPRGKRLQRWMLDKSNGVPGFMIALFDAARGAKDTADFDQLPVPYDLFAMVEERIDALGVDRNTLFRLSSETYESMSSLSKDELEHAHKAGFLKKNRQSSVNKNTYIHANPTVAWVMANSFERRNAVFAG